VISLLRAGSAGLKQSRNTLAVPLVFCKGKAQLFIRQSSRNRAFAFRLIAWRLRMEETMGVLWFLQIVLGPLILGLALLYGTFQWRRRRRLQGEGNYTTREVVMIALPVVIGVVIFTVLMMIPGSQ